MVAGDLDLLLNMSESKKKSKHRHTPSRESKSRDALTSNDAIENDMSHSECDAQPRARSDSDSSLMDIRGAMRPLEGTEDSLIMTRQASARRTTLISKKSPAKSAASLYSDIHQINHTDYILTLDKLGLASCIDPLACYKFLENCPMDPYERSELKNELFTLLRTDNYGYSSITDSKLISSAGKIHNTVENIPGLLPSLRQWIRLVSMEFSSSLQNVFLCVTKPDPLSDPNFISLYQ